MSQSESDATSPASRGLGQQLLHQAPQSREGRSGRKLSGFEAQAQPQRACPGPAGMCRMPLLTLRRATLGSCDRCPQRLQPAEEEPELEEETPECGQCRGRCRGGRLAVAKHDVMDDTLSLSLSGEDACQ